MMILNFHNKDFSQSKEIPVKAEGYTYILNSDLESDFDLINDDTSKLLFTELFQEIKAIDLRLTTIEAKPARKWEQLVSLIFTGIVTAILGFVLAKLGL